MLPRDSHLTGKGRVLYALPALVIGVALALLPVHAAAIVLGGTVFLSLLLAQPLFGIAVTLIAGPLAALEAVALDNVLPINSGQLTFAAAVAGWLAWGVARRRIMIVRTPLLVPFGLFLTIAALSLLGAVSFSYGLNELIKWIELGIIMLVVVDLVLSNQRTISADATAVKHEDQYHKPLRAVVGMLLLAGAVQAIVGIWQFGLRGTGPEHFTILGSYYRAYGTFEQPNPFGGFMALMATLAFGVLLGLISQRSPAAVAFKGRGRSELEERGNSFPWLWFFFVTACALLCSLALLFSWSRGAWLGFAAGVAAMILFWPRKRWAGIMLLVAGFALFALSVQLGVVPASVADRLISFQEDIQVGDVRGVDINDANYAVLERLAHWQSALDMAQDRPWLGVGFGNYEPAYPEYALINWPIALGHAHNFYLNIVAETGFVGAAAYLLFWAAVFWQTLRLLRRLSWPERGVVLGLLGTWTALSVHHLLDNLYVNNVHLHLGVMLGILQVLYLVEDRQGQPVSRRLEEKTAVND